MHRPNFLMSLSSMDAQDPKEQQFGPPILVTTPCDESAPFETLAEDLAPMVTSPPRTPVPKSGAEYDGDQWKRHSLCSEGDEEMTRPSSAASMYSSSSACSFGSMTSFNSFPASSQSPRHEKRNSFDAASTFGQDDDADTTIGAGDSQKTPRAARRQHKQDSTKDADWSKTFDLHLWGAYVAYQSNPTMTPFYVPPGGCPPIGVCIRVAREAKRTWRVPKTIQETDLTSPTERLSRTNSESLLPIDATLGEGSLRRRRSSRVQIPSRRKEVVPRAWPYSEAATRQRLRILSRRITENPHLQTRHGRLASPIRIKEFAPPCANIAEETQFSTRSLSFSLMASTSEAMQSDGPLASLSRPLESEEGTRAPQGDVPLAHDVFKPTLEPSYEAEDEIELPIPEVIPGHRRTLSSTSAHRRSGSKASILHRKTEGNGIGHRRTTSAVAATKPGEQAVESFATPRRRTRVRSSSDATIRSTIPRMLCLGSPFGAVEEEGDDARLARRSHKRHQSLETPIGRRGPPTLMPAFDFTKQEAYQNALRQQEQDRLAQRPATSVEGKKKDHFFEDLFGANASRTNLSERSSTPSIAGSDGASISVPSKKARARGMSFTDKIRGSSSTEFIAPAALRRISAPPDQIRPSVLKRLGSPFRDSEFAPLDGTLNQSQLTLPDAPAADMPAAAGLGSAFTSPPRSKKRDSNPPPRERGILGFGLGFFRRGKKETSQQH
ncbi:hypothetical protein TWF225_002469 [Orbilia oligospora]|nr:hypothetical protein TWF225_002469 [Orbilia oligospora]KAF3266294.1 hypothetical protein TWF217_001965 [Orbilia oligospora]KAF3268583.1 hypothetical protein TWF128_006974 [Orbilia oligospora]KAF3297049.1 hypothetical protein TWF132_008417 [Orbilia oligospora]